jgi:hypothetical protein
MTLSAEFFTSAVTIFSTGHRFFQNGQQEFLQVLETASVFMVAWAAIFWNEAVLHYHDVCDLLYYPLVNRSPPLQIMCDFILK